MRLRLSIVGNGAAVPFVVVLPLAVAVVQTTGVVYALMRPLMLLLLVLVHQLLLKVATEARARDAGRSSSERGRAGGQAD